MKSLLSEGKEPPQYREIGKSVELIINASNVSVKFLNLLNNIKKNNHILDVDHLIILNYLMKHREINLSEASRITQRGIEQARDVLSYMENQIEVIESNGNTRNKKYMMSYKAYDLLGESTKYYRDRDLDDMSAKAIILSTLKDRDKLTNSEIRQITSFNSKKVIRLMKELEREGVKLTGKGRGSYYYLDNKNSK